MPKHAWLSDPIVFAQALDQRDVEASALIVHAAWCVDALRYLGDIEAADDLHGHVQETVDVARARWATGTAITAVDLVAAALGRLYCGATGPRAFDLRSFSTNHAANRSALPPSVLAWVDSTQADPDYVPVLDLRKPMTHSRVPRHLALNTGSGSRPRVGLPFGSATVEVPEIIERSTAFATRHVEALLTLTL